MHLEKVDDQFYNKFDFQLITQLQKLSHFRMKKSKSKISVKYNQITEMAR